jgi:hypothetical protein
MRSALIRFCLLVGPNCPIMACIHHECCQNSKQCILKVRPQNFNCWTQVPLTKDSSFLGQPAVAIAIFPPLFARANNFRFPPLSPLICSPIYTHPWSSSLHHLFLGRKLGEIECLAAAGLAALGVAGEPRRCFGTNCWMGDLTRTMKKCCLQTCGF